MDEDELLKGEKLEKILSPHPLSFMRFQSLSIFLIIWGIVAGWLINFSEWNNLFSVNEWLAILVWGIVLLLAGIIASILTIRWIIFFLYLGVFAGGVALMLSQGWLDTSGIFIPFYMVSVSIIGFLFVEAFRRSHKYIISNQRLVFKGGIITKRERSLRYENIVEFNSERGILAQIFGFGTIIPQTPSGVGMGSDSALAGGGIAIGGNKGKLFGIFGGGKEIQTPRTRSYYELHGIYPFKDIKKLLESYKRGTAPTTHHEEQVAFQKEQVDIQKQMRDLLKMQSDSKSIQKEEISEE
jgi:hypothetical protein